MRFTELQIDGETYKLVWDFNALCEAEGMTGCSLLSLSTSTQMRGAFYASLRTYHSQVDLAGAGRLIGIAGVARVMEALGAAFELSTGKKEVVTQ